MLIAIVRRGDADKRFVIEWRHLFPEVRYGMLGGRLWSDSEVRILIEHQHDLKRAAEILERPYGAVRVKWHEVRKKLGLKKNAKVWCLTFPEPDISFRTELIEKLLSGSIEIHNLLLNDLKEMLTNKEMRKMLTIKEKALLTRILIRLWIFIEKIQTGKEHLEIYREEKERADRP